MATSKLLSLQVSDIIKWFRESTLIINDTFQRHSVWTVAGKTFLIDTILNELPIPKIYLRVKINPKTQESIREIVDGQQRIRTFIEFADDKLKLTSRSEKFSGLTYSSLEPEDQEKFLGYTLGVEQLLNAADDDVIDIFKRLNSYTVPLNEAEKRHAKYQTDFKWAVRKAAQDWKGFWEKFGIFSIKERFRMQDDVLMAEIFGIFLEGVRDGGARNIDALYKRQDEDTFTKSIHKSIRDKIDATLSFFDEKIGQALSNEFSKPFHILILVAAYANNRWGIPQGQLESIKRHKLASPDKIMDGLSTLENILSQGNPPKKYQKFYKACKGSTHRIASRKARFEEIIKVFSD